MRPEFLRNERQRTSSALRIGDVAARSGVTAKAIRHYEAVGLLPPPRRSAAGYRLYDESAIKELTFIRRGKALGLTLSEIKLLLSTARSGSSQALRSEVVAVLDEKLEEHDRRIAELVARREALSGQRRLAVLNARAAPCECHGLTVDCPCLPMPVASV